MTRALITGISGMTGSYLCEQLLVVTDWDIFGMVRSYPPYPNLRADVLGNPRVTLLKGDLRDDLTLRAVVENALPDYVFHLAAQSDTHASFTNAIDTYKSNVLGVTYLLDAIRAAKLDPAVHICSSSEIFGRVSREELPIGENCRLHPASPYAISRSALDLIGRFYAEAYGMRTVITRAFTHTGPRRSPRFAESDFAKQIATIEKVGGKPVVLVGNLASLRTWTDVRDMVNAYHLAATTPFEPGTCYNIGSDFSCSVGNALATLIDLSTCNGIDVHVHPDRFRPLDADLQVCDSSKFLAKTGWRPEIPFEHTMADLLRYWRDELAQ